PSRDAPARAESGRTGPRRVALPRPTQSRAASTQVAGSRVKMLRPMPQGPGSRPKSQGPGSRNAVAQVLLPTQVEHEVGPGTWVKSNARHDRISCGRQTSFELT